MILYEIYIKSFNDSNGDGIGDINGIIEKLEYLSHLGIDAIWVTPFYPSPMVDNGYDVSDYINIKKEYGTIEDFKNLVEKARLLNIKIIIDVVFNHTSDKHLWFEKSIKKIEPYSDYYIWAEKPLNDWESMFKGSAWTYNEQRGEYYLHRFAKEQPDLNFLNEKVVIECIEILEYWKELGVDGFRFDVVNFFISDKEKLASNSKDDIINHKNTLNIIRRIKKAIIDKYSETIFIGEVGSEDLEVLRTYENSELMDYVFSFNIGSMKNFDLKLLAENINKTFSELNNPTIFFSSHDMSRYFRRLCSYDKNKYFAFTGLISLLQGMSIFYQGDEFMVYDEIIDSPEKMKDIQSVNEYNLLISQGLDKNEAFEKAVKNNRDYSRALIEWRECELIDTFREMIAFRKEFLDNLEFINIKNIDNTLIIEYSENITVTINFENGSIVVKNDEKDLKKYHV